MDNAHLAAKWEEKTGKPFDNKENAAPRIVDVVASAMPTPANSPAPSTSTMSRTPSQAQENRNAGSRDPPAHKPPIAEEPVDPAVDCLPSQSYVPFSSSAIAPTIPAAVAQGQRIALINKVLDRDIVEFATGGPPSLLRTLQPTELFEDVRGAIEFARHPSQLLVNWRNCVSHHVRLKALKLDDPEGVLNDLTFMKEELEGLEREAKAVMGPLQAVLEKYAGQEAVDRVIHNGLASLAHNSQQDQVFYQQQLPTINTINESSCRSHSLSTSDPRFFPSLPVNGSNRSSSILSNRKSQGQDYILHNNNPHRYGGALPTLGPMAVPQERHGTGSIATRANTPTSRYTTPISLPTNHCYSSHQLGQETNQCSPIDQPQPPGANHGPRLLTEHEIYHCEREAYNAHKAEQAAQKTASDALLERKRKELQSDPDVLLYRYREYNSVFPLPPGELVNRYYTTLLANQTTAAADVGSEKAKIVAYAKRHYFNLYRAAGGKELNGKRDRGDEDLVKELVIEEERLQTLGLYEARRDRLKRRRGVEESVEDIARWF